MSLAQAMGKRDIALIDQTIGDNLEATAAQFPDREALVSRHQSRRFTYAEFNEAVDLVARGLLAAGLEVGRPAGECGVPTTRSGFSSSTPPPRLAWSS